MTNNPNNYEGVTIDNLVGRVGNDPEYPLYDKEGSRGFKEIRVAVSQGYKDRDGDWVDTGTAWFTFTAPEDELAGVGKGDKVRIEGSRLQTREFTRKDGTTGQAFDLRFGTIAVLYSKSTPVF